MRAAGRSQFLRVAGGEGVTFRGCLKESAKEKFQDACSLRVCKTACGCGFRPQGTGLSWLGGPESLHPPPGSPKSYVSDMNGFCS